MAGVKLMRAEELKPEATPTPGMTREEAFSDSGKWCGYVHTAAGMTSGWHHHDDYDTVVYVVTGAIRMESGPGGQELVNAKAGDFIFVPKRAIHRESNPTQQESGVVVVRVGSGRPVVNVDGPAEA